jgi:hypothetical protein
MPNTNCKRQNVKKNRIKKDAFFLSYSSLLNTGFSLRITYISLKRQIMYKSLFSKNTKYINLKLKQSRHMFKSANNLANVNGIFRAI